MNLKLASTLLLITPASARNLRAERHVSLYHAANANIIIDSSISMFSYLNLIQVFYVPHLTFSSKQKRFLNKNDFTGLCAIMPNCYGEISAKDLEKAGDKTIDKVIDENEKDNDNDRHRRMKQDNTFGFVVDHCNKKEAEKAIEKAIESASGDSEEVNEKTDLDMTCVQIPPSFPEASALKLTWRKLQRRPRTKQQKRSATTRVAVA